MLSLIQMFTAVSSFFSGKCVALCVVSPVSCVLPEAAISYLLPSSELPFLPMTHLPPFSTKGKPRPRTAPAPPLQSLVRCPWFSFPPVSWDGQFLLSSCQRPTPPGDRPSHLLSPRQETFLILSPPSLPRRFPISVQYASVLHPLFAHPLHSAPWFLLPPLHQTCQGP